MNYILDDVKKMPLLSICIPSYGRIELLRNTLNSIYSQMDDVCEEDFEVIISDNDPKRALQCLVDEFEYSNFKYYATDCNGFLNSYYVLSYGTGALIKLHNNTMLWKPNSLKNLLQMIRNNMEKKPLIFFTNGLRQTYAMHKFNKFDEFMYDLSYLSSWSNGFCIWKDDLDFDKIITVNEYFPQTSVLLTQYYKESFISTDYPFFELQKVSKKGGYNIFKVFGIYYIELIEIEYFKGHISKKTFNKIKKGILLKFFPLNFFKTKILKVENYDTHGLKENLKRYYPWYAYYILVILGFFFMPHYVYKFIRTQYLKNKIIFKCQFEKQLL
jgi:abequosyltransferase